MSERAPILPDPHGTAQRVAMEIMECEPGSRRDAVRKAAVVYVAIALASGRSETEAVEFASEMQRLIGNAVAAIEVSGGSAGGRA
jgi:hypothetical protein